MQFSSLRSSGLDNNEMRKRMDAVRRRQRPANEVPVTVPVDAVLAETADLVVCITGVQVFSSGLDLRLMAMSRRSEAEGHGQGFSAAVFGHGDPRDRVLLGVEFSDGRTADNLSRGHGYVDDPAFDDFTTPVLLQQGGSGGDGHVDLSLYLSPLPSAGPLSVIAAWPGRGVAERVTKLPAEPFIEAASRVRVLWDPVEAEDRSGPPPLPEVPPYSWFDQHRATPEAPA
jgi:hypothetical protein